MTYFKVVEIFQSINGEGMCAGELAVFVRFQGCNLCCSYCDTSWANQKDAKVQWMTEEEIYEVIKKTGIRNVTLTGGEPLIQKDVEQLITKLTQDPFLRVEIETNGSVSILPFTRIKNRPVFTLDYKCPESGMEEKMNVDNFQNLIRKDSVKMVVSNQKDLDAAKKIMERYRLTEKCNVLLSPVFGKIELEEIVDFIKNNQLNDVRMQLQMHKFIWDPNARGV